MLKQITTALVGSVLLLAAQQSEAALSLSNTRLIVQSHSSNSVEVINGAESRYGMQAWVEDEAGKDPGKMLVVTPQFLAIEAHKKAVLRLLSFENVTGQERLYYLNVQEIPPKAPDDGHSHLAMAARTKIKVLIRPTELNADRKNAEQKIEVYKTAKGLRFVNPTPYYLAITKVIAGGKEYSRTPLGTFAPKSEVKLNIANVGTTLNVVYLDDYGSHGNVTLTVKAGH